MTRKQIIRRLLADADFHTQMEREHAEAWAGNVADALKDAGLKVTLAPKRRKTP